MAKQRGYSDKEIFDRNYEGTKSAYETYKRSSDPSASRISERLGQGDKDAIRAVERATRASDQERRREYRRGNR